MNSVVSRPDPMRFWYADYPHLAIASARASKTVRYPLLNTGETTGVFITAGQSLAAGSQEGHYTPTNAA